MSKSLNIWLVNIVLSAFFMSCEDNNDGGFNLKPTGSILNSTVIDTFTVNLSTVRELENITSGGSSVLLAGAYTDEEGLGDVYAETYFQVLPADDYNVPSGAICDSVIMFVDYYGYEVPIDESDETEEIHHYYGDDPFTNLNFQVRELTEGFSYEDSYATSQTMKYSEEVIGESGAIMHIPESNEQFSFDVDVAYGSKVLLNYSNNNTDFLDEMPGLALVLDPTNMGAVFGFTTDVGKTYIQIYYHEDGDTEVEGVKLQIVSAAERFNHIKTDLSNTQLSVLEKTGGIISGLEANNRTYIQGGTGIRTLVEIPYLKTFLDNNKGILVNKVELALPVDENSWDQFYNAPPHDISIFEADENNLIIRDENNDPDYVLNEGNAAGVNKDKKYYPFDESENSYIVNLGLFTQNHITNETRDYKLIVSPYGSVRGGQLRYTEGSSVHRAVLLDAENADKKCTFKLYYTTREQ